MFKLKSGATERTWAERKASLDDVPEKSLGRGATISRLTGMRRSRAEITRRIAEATRRPRVLHFVPGIATGGELTTNSCPKRQEMFRDMDQRESRAAHRKTRLKVWGRLELGMQAKGSDPGLILDSAPNDDELASPLLLVIPLRARQTAGRFPLPRENHSQEGAFDDNGRLRSPRPV